MKLFHQYTGFFGEQLNHELYELAVNKNEIFSLSRTSESHYYPEWRKSKVIYDSQFSYFKELIEKKVRERLDEIRGILGVGPFEIASFEVQLTSHNDGDYFKYHKDNSTPDSASRLITFVYYFHALPRSFTGGELVIHDGNDRHQVEPVNDSIVFFHSGRTHEVRPVVCPGKLFKDGRFTLNGWVRRKEIGRTSLRGDDLSSQLEKQMKKAFLMTDVNRKEPVVPGTGQPEPSSARQEMLSKGQELPSASLEPALKGVELPSKRVEKLESLLNFYSDLYRQSGEAGKIPVREHLSGKDFFEQYYFRNRPVILRSMMRDWPALEKWCPDYLLKRYGHIPVEITRGREKEAGYEKEFHKTVATVPFGEFIQQIEGRPSSNDIYLVARNYFFSNPAFRPLRDDIIPPGEIIDTAYDGLKNIKLWFGPGGTVTPLHHDKHSILFCQVYGRKHFKMIPSFELPRIYNKDRYYSEVDPVNVDGQRHPLFQQASMADVIINPGEMLLIPAGWWHWVKSLEVSISVTFSNFRIPGYNTVWNCE